MAVAKTKNNSGRSSSICLPDMAPFAGVIFLIVCFYALTTRFKDPRIGNVALEELPRCDNSACMPYNMESVIGLDTDGHYSFSVSGPLFQTTTIQKVAATYGIVFSTLQLSHLNKIAYLDADIRDLPAILVRQSYQQSSDLIAKYRPLGDEQLLACVTTSKKVIQTMVHNPSYVSLLVNSETNASRVMHLIALLQTQGINRFNLKLQDGVEDEATR